MTRKASEPFVFDPKMFITGPFHPCPECGQMQFGTLSIRGNVHSRRCRHCFHNESETLPPLKKKLIYLDQMVLSGIAKEIDPVWREKTQHRDDFWLQAFDRIDRLVKLQLIVCPDSPIHEEESSYDDRYESVLRRLYEHLASGVSLHFPHQVHMAQLWEAFEAWSTNQDPDWARITRDDFVDGRLDRWSDRLLLTVNMGHWPGRIESRRNSRASGHDTLTQLWDKWVSERHVSFEERLEIERRGFADGALQSYVAHVKRWQRVNAGVEEVTDPLELMPGWLVQLVTGLLRRLEERGVPHGEQLPQVVDFLYSEPALCAPQNHMGALLYAALARRAASGQRRVPSRGTPNDIAFIASYLPYCDVMFIDNECADLLSEEPLASAVKDYPARIFSTRSRKEFLTYLATLESEADPDHVALVVRTYGKSWLEPFRAILEQDRSKRNTPS